MDIPVGRAGGARWFGKDGSQGCLHYVSDAAVWASGHAVCRLGWPMPLLRSRPAHIDRPSPGGRPAKDICIADPGGILAFPKGEGRTYGAVFKCQRLGSTGSIPELSRCEV